MSVQLTDQDNLFTVSLNLGRLRGTVLMTTDRVPVVGDVLDLDPDGAYRVVGIEHYIPKDGTNGYRLRKTTVICEPCKY